MRLALGLGLLLIAALPIAAVGLLYLVLWAHHVYTVGVSATSPRMVAGLGVLVFVCAYFGARLTPASIRAAAERQAEAIRRL